MEYDAFIHEKSQFGDGCGFVPEAMPDYLYDFQKALVGWSLKLGRSAIFADCGMGKTAMQLDVIGRCIQLWSNPGEVVLTPFMGVGSEVYGAVAAGRRGIGCELKPSYFRQAKKNLEALSAQLEAGGKAEERTLF